MQRVLQALWGFGLGRCGCGGLGAGTLMGWRSVAGVAVRTPGVLTAKIAAGQACPDWQQRLGS